MEKRQSRIPARLISKEIMNENRCNEIPTEGLACKAPTPDKVGIIKCLEEINERVYELTNAFGEIVEKTECLFSRSDMEAHLKEEFENRGKAMQLYKSPIAQSFDEVNDKLLNLGVSMRIYRDHIEL
jgi:hypothetical protein